MNNPFDFDTILNGYTNDDVSVAGSDLHFQFESPRIDFGLENYEQPIENIDDLLEGSRPRKTLILEETSVALLFKNQRFNCRKTFQALEMFGYFLPPYRSRCITYNYLLGVCNKTYFGLLDQVRSYPHRSKLTSRVIYCELLKIVNVPLGYNSTNLPSKKYLLTLLFHLCPLHAFFVSDVTDIALPQTADGLFYVPESCRGLIKVNKKSALFHSAIAARGGRADITRKLTKAASIICAVESVKNQLAGIKLKLSKFPALEEDKHLKSLNNLLNKIN